MRLTDALRLWPGMSVAFVGAGGKSSALAALAREGPAPVLLTTSTRVGREQSNLASAHLIVREASDLDRIPSLLVDHQSLLVTGPLTDADTKWNGLEEPLLKALSHESRKAGAVLAIEADGARGFSLKVPAAHEPVLPDFVDIVSPLVGLDVLGTSLGGGHVHRPEGLADFLGVPVTDAIDQDAIVRILMSAEGALKDVPDSADVRVLLNKADDAERLEKAEGIAGRVLAARPAGPTPSSIRSVLATRLGSQDPVAAAWGRVAGVVLAAGGSSRLDRPKPLVSFRGRSLVTYAVQAALGAGLSPVTVVVGHAAEAVRQSLDSFPVRIIENPDWQAGQSSSLRLGLEEVEASAEAVVFFLADMPFVSSTTVRRIVRRYSQTLAPVVAPAAAGRRGNPVLFDRATFPSLASLTGDTGGRAVFGRFPVEEVACDEAELMDVDTPSDLERLWSME